MGLVGALHSLRSFRRRLPWALEFMQPSLDTSVSGAIARIIEAAADDARGRVQRILSVPGTRLLIHDGDEYLFAMQAVIRDEYPQYQFFVLGHLIEVRRMSHFSNEYSFADFPLHLADRRPWIEDRFAAVSVKTENGMGWFAPMRWQGLTEVQQSMCRPRFVADNRRYF